MDIGKSLTYMFDDERWVNKVLIGGLIGLVPILNLAQTGYMLRTLKNVAAGADKPMPDWDDFGNDFVKGLLVAVAGFLYALPIIALVTLFVIAVSAGGVFTAGAGSDAANAFGVLTAFGTVCFATLGVLLGLLIAAWMPAATAVYAVSGEFGAFFRFGEIWGLIKRNVGNYVVVLLIAFVASQIAGWLGALVLIVGAAFTGFWSALVYGHLLGQLVHEDRGAPAPVA